MTSPATPATPKSSSVVTLRPLLTVRRMIVAGLLFVLLLLIEVGWRRASGNGLALATEPHLLSSRIGFYPLFTLLAAGVASLLAKIIAFLFRRRESYYNE